MKMQASSDSFLFEEFRLDRLGGGLFRRDDQGAFVPVAIGSRALDILTALIERRGDIVSKEEIIAAVWPQTVVEENNLFVQISALRRILDREQSGQSCIQTIAGRGYRFIAPVTLCTVGTDQRPQDLSPTGAEPSFALAEPLAIAARRAVGARIHSRAALALLALFCAIVAITAVIVQWSRTAAPSSDGTPIVVMPFRNQGDGAPQAKIGEAIAERIAVELARLPATRIVGQNTAAAYADRSMNSRQLYRELRVRYAVDGSVTAAGRNMGVEAALVDTTADTVRWSDHFDFAGGPSPQLADEIVTLIIRPLVRSLEQEEANRAAAKEPAEQTADDLVWRGAAAFDRPLSQANRGQARELFEKALMLNPRNVWALSRLAHVDITDVMN